MKAVVTLILSLLSAAVLPAAAAGITEPEAAALFQRVVGIDPREQDTKPLVGISEDEALKKLFANPFFVNNRLATLASRLTNEEGEPFENGDDFQTSIVLAILEDIDFRDIFSRPYLIRNKRNNAIVAPEANNHTVSNLSKMSKERRLDFQVDGVEGNVSNGIYREGVFTTSGFGARTMRMSTNRKVARAPMDLFLCSKIESWKDATLEPHWIGRDITRNPSQKGHHFQQDCRGCHAPMDAMRGASAYYDYDMNMQRLVRSDRVVEKLNRNSSAYAQGGDGTIDDAWENLLVTPVHQARFGWRGATEGNGLLSFATMIANAEQFQVCMTQRVLKEFCDLTPKELADRMEKPEFKQLAEQFRSEGYKMKSLIRKIVKSDLCD